MLNYFRLRHPRLAGVLALSSIFLAIGFLNRGLFAAPVQPGSILVGLAFLALGWFLFGTPGLPGSQQWENSDVPIEPASGARIQTGSPIPDIMSRTASLTADLSRGFGFLPNHYQVEIFNYLEPNEEPAFALAGEDESALVGTDRRVFVVPEGRDGLSRMLARPYSMLSNGQIIPHRNGGRLVLLPKHDIEHIPSIPLANEQSINRAMKVLSLLRLCISDAHLEEQEENTPAEQSAFAETAHASIPSTRRAQGLGLGDLLAMNPTEFEEFTGKALHALGYRDVVRVGGAGDLGADLTATDPQGRSVVVQCKRYSPGSRVGSPALQSFIGMREVHHKADRGIFVTTADYTQQAIDLANEHDVVLIDGTDLVKIAALVLAPAPQRASSTASDRARFCINCGEPIHPSAKYCSNCGTATEQTSLQDT